VRSIGSVERKGGSLLLIPQLVIPQCGFFLSAVRTAVARGDFRDGRAPTHIHYSLPMIASAASVSGLGGL